MKRISKSSYFHCSSSNSFPCFVFNWQNRPSRSAGAFQRSFSSPRATVASGNERAPSFVVGVCRNASLRETSSHPSTSWLGVRQTSSATSSPSSVRRHRDSSARASVCCLGDTATRPPTTQVSVCVTTDCCFDDANVVVLWRNRRDSLHRSAALDDLLFQIDWFSGHLTDVSLLLLPNLSHTYSKSLQQHRISNASMDFWTERECYTNTSLYSANHPLCLTIHRCRLPVRLHCPPADHQLVLRWSLLLQLEGQRRCLRLAERACCQQRHTAKTPNQQKVTAVHHLNEQIYNNDSR